MKSIFSIRRNAIIFILSLGLLMFTQIWRQGIAADTSSKEQKNKYIDLLHGADFDVECEKGSDPSKPEVTPKTGFGRYLLDTGNVGKVIDKYHEVTNCLFNQRIGVMVDKMMGVEMFGDYQPLTPDKLDVIAKLLAPPEQIKNQAGEITGRKTCKGVDGNPNISTYCLAEEATDEYFEFREAMVSARVSLKQEAYANSGSQATLQRSIPGTAADLVTGQQNLLKYGEQINEIDRELNVSRQSLDQALAAYNEMQMALPLHRKYMEIIKALEVYRDKIADIRTKVHAYPAEFLDVTTASCT